MLVGFWLATGEPGVAVDRAKALHQAHKDRLLTAERADVGDDIFDLIVLERSPPGWHQR
jgi:hypothetical protein